MPGRSRALNLPVAFDTDVNGAALGEGRWGAAQGLDTFIYLTIGTGIGGGAMVGGSLLHGLLHPEMGHVRLPHDRQQDPYPGRWGRPAETLPVDHPAWSLEAHYLALGLVNFIVTLSPQRMILGGGVMEQAHLFPLVRRRVLELLNGYVQSPRLLEAIDTYIVPPALGRRAGVLGALALAQQAGPPA